MLPSVWLALASEKIKGADQKDKPADGDIAATLPNNTLLPFPFNFFSCFFLSLSPRLSATWASGRPSNPSPKKKSSLLLEYGKLKRRHPTDLIASSSSGSSFVSGQNPVPRLTQSGGSVPIAKRRNISPHPIWPFRSQLQQASSSPVA